MYNNYFGFSESPFNITPNSRFYYRTPSCDEALSIVKHGIETRKGVIVVTGEPGTGKTLLLKFLVRDIAPRVLSVIVQDPHSDLDGILRLLLNRLDLHGAGDDRTARLELLTNRLIEQVRSGRIVCLLIDEAQDLDTNTLDELRLLSNLEFEGQALLPIILLGQPELHSKLDRPSSRRIKQRVALTRHLYPLIRMEIGPYIESRLKVANHQGPPLFDREAIERIAVYSGGIPRMVNSICDNSLIRAYTAGQSVISGEIVDQVAVDLRIAGHLSVQRQAAQAGFSEVRSEPSAASDYMAPVTKEAEERRAQFFEAAMQDVSTAQRQDSHPAISPDPGAEAIRQKPVTNTPADTLLRPKSEAERREGTDGSPDFHPRAGIPHDWLPLRIRWYAIAAAIALLLLLLNIVSSSQLTGIYSVASTTKRATVIDDPSGRAQQEQGTDSFKSNEAFVIPAPPPKPLIIAPQRVEIEASQPWEAIETGPGKAPSNNGKNPEATNASQPKPPGDGEPRRAERADAAGVNRKKGEDRAKTLKVVAASLLRDKPSASAHIISTLEPGSRVTVLATSRDFYHVRSTDERSIRGYVHREDAFFERKSSR